MGDDLSDELRALEAGEDDVAGACAGGDRRIVFDLSEDDLDFNTGTNDELDARLTDLDNEIGQIEDRLDLTQDAELESVAEADLSDDLSGGASAGGLSEELSPDLSEQLAEDFLDSVDETGDASVGPDIAATALDLNAAGDEALELSAEGEGELEDDFEFLAGTDEAATKLDLARAYIEMGDREGARDILEEVLEEGNEDQKQDAAKLIEGLS
ncbi:MAG: hypothetical protein IPM37_07650 [Hahellaceae bacterium]|nr:hypothetical protein [Hahellaceae bacterium]